MGVILGQTREDSVKILHLKDAVKILKLPSKLCNVLVNMNILHNSIRRYLFFTAPFIAAKKYEVSVSCCIADIFRCLIKHALQRNVDDFLPLAAGKKRLKYHYKGSLHAFFMSRSEIHVHECIFHACFLTLMILHVFQLQSYCLNSTHAC